MTDIVKLASDNKVSELQKTLTAFKEELPILLKFQVYQAQLTRAHYLALIEEGFSEEQALRLCKQ